MGRLAAAPRSTRIDPALIALGLLTAAALALRLRGIGEGLYHDELYTWDETHGRSFGGMLDAIANGASPGAPVERTPPLYFVLAWLCSKLGSPQETIRLPSILLGTATVPLVYALGLRTVGRAAALFGALFAALSPFAIFYGIEARAYATLMFLAALSALLVLQAVEARRRGWWIAYALTVAAMLYTHYIGVIVIATEAVWLLWRHRELWRPALLSYAGAAVLFAPWLPYYSGTSADYEKLAALVGIDDWGAFLQWVAGSPDELPADLPGTAVLVVLAVAAGIGLVWAVRAGGAIRRSPGLALVLLLAVSTPLVLLAYAQVGDDLFVYPRNLIAALPFLGLALGWVITRPPRAVAIAAVALAAGALVVAAARTLEDRFHRPDAPGVAHALDRDFGAGSPVVYYGPGFDPLIIRDLLDIYLEEPHPVRGAAESETSLRRALEIARARFGARPVPVVEFQYDRQEPIAHGWDQLSRRVFAGSLPLILSTYAPLDGARYRNLSIAPRAVTGAVDSATLEKGTLTLGGWAVTADSEPPEHLLAYVGDRLVAAGVPNRSRPDVSKGQGLDTDEVGFMLALPGSLTARERAAVRIVGTDGHAVTEIQRYCSPQVKLLLGCEVRPG